MAIIKLNIAQMHCSACSSNIEENLLKLPFIKSAKVNAISGIGRINYDETKANAKQIMELITSYGFPASLDSKEQDELAYILSLKRRFFVALPIFFIIFMLHVGGFHGIFSDFLQVFLATITQIYCAYPFYKGSLSIFKTKKADMNLLITLGTTSAYFYSLFVFFGFYVFDIVYSGFYFEGSVSVICFILLGEFLKTRGKKRVRDELNLLSKILPQNARVLENIESKNPKLMPIESLNIGDICLVLCGEKVPADGIIMQGSAEVNTAILDGEEMPKVLKKDSTILAGSILLNGEILIRVNKQPESFFVNSLIDLMETTQEKSAKIGEFAEKVASIFVPCVVLIAAIALAFWAIKMDFSFALSIGACVLIISCPCALGLATPLAITCATLRAKRANVLVKNANIYENINKINTIIFDKTGTLTKGKITIKRAEIFGDLEFIKNLVLSMQLNNPHPVALALVEFAKGAKILNLESKTYEISKGVKAEFNGKSYFLGNDKFILENTNLSNFKSGIILASKINQKCEILAIFYLSDSLRIDAKNSIEKFQKMGKEIVILSGDNKESVKKVAQSLGVESYFYQQSPEQKAEFVREHAKCGVCFIGDGINDALALKEASVGISFAEATDLAQEVGDALLLKSDLNGVVDLFYLSKQTIKNIKQNLFFAYIYNIILIPLAAGVLYLPFNIVLTPAIAGAAMALSSFSVVLNALRILRINFMGVKYVK